MNAAARQVAMIISLRYSAACTGFVCRSAYLSSLPSWYTSASVDLDGPTWPTPFSRSPRFAVDNACGPRRRRHWTRLSTVGDRAFPVAAARTWNSLPAAVTSSNSLQTFKTKLKSYFLLALFPWFLNCYSVCKVFEVLWHFSR